MNADDKDWPQLAPLLLHSGDDMFQDPLHPYLTGDKNIFDDLHSGVAHDAHALFGGPVESHASVRLSNLGQNGIEEHAEGLRGTLKCDGEPTKAPDGASGHGGKVLTQPAEGNSGTNQSAQRGLWAHAQKAQNELVYSPAEATSQHQQPQAELPVVVLAQQQHQQVPRQSPAANAQSLARTPQQVQPVSTPSPQQQQQQHQQQPVHFNSAQIQAIQQQQQHQQQLTGYPAQQAWALQQQLWSLQQQSVLLAAQQQQQYAGAAATAPVLLPMGLQLGFTINASAGVNGLKGVFSSGTLTQQQQQQAALTTAVAQSPSAALQLYGLLPHLQQPAMPAAQYGLAAAAAVNGSYKRGRSGGRGTGAAVTPAAAAAAAAVAAATAAHRCGNPIVATKQRERNRSVVSTLEAEVAEKLAQLQVLSAENEMLKLRAAVLEATVANREDQMRVISQHGPPVYPIDVPDQLPANSSDTGSPKSSASGGIAQRGKVLTNLGADLRSSASTCGELVVQPTTPRGTATAADIFVKAEADSAPAGVDGLVDQTQELDPAAMFGGKAPVLDEFWPDVEQGREIIKRMSVEDVVRHWKQFLHDVTGQLVNVQKEESMTTFTSSRAAADGKCGDAAAGLGCSASMKRITNLVEKYSFLIKTAQQLNPGAYCRLFGQNLDTGLPAPYSDAHWRRVVSVLGLNKEQVNMILACAELYFACRAKLQTEQRVMQQQLKLTCASAAEKLLSITTADDNPMKPWLDKLANNLKREHVLRVMLNGFVWFKVFTPVQCAKAAVYSHPFFVDVHAMVCVMCEDALASPASSTQRSLVFPHYTAHNGPTPQAVM